MAVHDTVSACLPMSLGAQPRCNRVSGPSRDPEERDHEGGKVKATGYGGSGPEAHEDVEEATKAILRQATVGAGAHTVLISIKSGEIQARDHDLADAGTF